MFENRLCKAKRLDNGRWIAGYFFASSAMESRESDEGTERRTFVCPMAQGKPDNSVELVEVDPETVCRCVGLGIRECHQTDRMAYQKRKRLVYDGDLITVFSLTPVGNGVSHPTPKGGGLG